MKPQDSEGFWVDWHKSISGKQVKMSDRKLNVVLYVTLAGIVGILALVRDCVK